MLLPWDGRRNIAFVGGCGLALLMAVGVAGATEEDGCDARAEVVIWGGTVCGITAALAAAQQERSVLWLVNGTRLGGMTSGGLGGRDGGSEIIGGYGATLWAPLGKNFEPGAAEARIRYLLDSGNKNYSGRIELRSETGWLTSVATTGAAPRRIVSATTMTGLKGCGQVWIDCSYEGDLLRLSGTEYAVGREAVSEFNESMAGQDAPPFASRFENPADFEPSVSPWTDATNTTLLPGIYGVYNGTPGAADSWVMSMNFRVCLTNNASNAIRIAAPEGYTAARMELVRREIAAATAKGYKLSLDTMFLVRHLPHQKLDLNSGAWDVRNSSGGYFPFSTDMPWLQHDWPLGDPATRQRVFDEHKWWTQALLYYLGNDPELRKSQPGLVASVAEWGLCGDEYTEVGHWTPQLYVRESVRLRGGTVITQADICDTTAPTVDSSVGLSKWGVDIHDVKRVAWKVDGTWRVSNIGGRDTMRSHDGCDVIIEVPYEAITPKAGDTANLLVPVCASFTHVAFSTFRLEPQYAIFGQSAGTAAALALKTAPTAPTVQAINVSELQQVLLSQGQHLHRTPTPVSPAPHQKRAWGCALGRCVGLAFGGDRNATCSAACPPLASNEWLANDGYGLWSTSGTELTAKKATFLRKSMATSATLPDDDKLAVKPGATCELIGSGTTDGVYRLCRH